MTRLETAQMLREHDNFIILTHRRPDGDIVCHKYRKYQE